MSPEVYKILVVDDEQDILHSLEYSLRKEGFQVLVAKDGKQAMQLFEQQSPHLLILDLMLPWMNGYEVCKQIRSQGSKVPILMLTAKTTEVDAVIGLEIGADDYIQKPARMKELIARVRTRLRGTYGGNNNEDSESQEEDDATRPGPEVIELGNLKVDSRSYTVLFHGQEISLTQREFELLKKLAQYPNRVFRRDQLLNLVWGWPPDIESRTVDVHVRYLREKLENDPANPKMLKTVRGIGYKLVPDTK